MAAITLNDEQTKLLRLCLKHSEPLKPNWEKVAEQGGFVSTSAASQRWGRLYKVLIGDEKAATPSKVKGKTSKKDGEKAKQKGAAKGATPEASMTLEEDMSITVNGETSNQPTAQTPKKRGAHDNHLASDTEDGTPAKLIKTEIKEEN